jgi:hypothetical protein
VGQIRTAPEEHGTFMDVLNGMSAAANQIDQTRIVRKIASRPDLFMVAGEMNRPSHGSM